MTEEPFFLVNEFLEKEKKELENVIETVGGKKQKVLEKSVFIRNFTNSLFKAYRKTKKSKEDKHNEVRLQEKELLIKKKQELLNKLKQMQDLDKKIEPQVLLDTKQLIISKETNIPIVTSQFDGKQYIVKEPELSENDLKILEELKKSIKSTNLENKQEFMEQLKNIAYKYSAETNNEYYDKIRYYVIRDLKKYGKVSPLIEDQDVKEIVCDSSSIPIKINYKNNQDILTNIKFNTDEELNEFVLNLAEKANQKVSVENPFLNTSLNKLNINATIGSEFIKPKFVITKI